MEKLETNYRFQTNKESSKAGRDAAYVQWWSAFIWSLRYQKDAVNRVCEISKNQETELLIHNKDGKTGSKDGHENDPSPPKG